MADRCIPTNQQLGARRTFRVKARRDQWQKKPAQLSSVLDSWGALAMGISRLAFGDSPTREGTNHARKHPLIQQTGGLRGNFHFETSRRIVNPFAFRSRLLPARPFSLSSFPCILLGLQCLLGVYLESADVDRHLQFLPLALDAQLFPCNANR